MTSTRNNSLNSLGDICYLSDAISGILRLRDNLFSEFRKTLFKEAIISDFIVSLTFCCIVNVDKFRKHLQEASKFFKIRCVLTW